MAILDPAIAVIDIGKTRSKLGLWSGGRAIAQADRPNQPVERAGVRQLDVDGIRGWLLGELAKMGRHAAITAIVPVAHGAAAVLMDGDRFVAALDYEAEPPSEIAAAYDRERDSFAATLSPRLPAGLNLGVQLFWLEQLEPQLWPRAGRAVLWPQYWARLLSGEHAAEVTSLGCHSDLWRPLENRWSDLALRRGWAERLGALRPAQEALGVLRPAIVAQTGLPSDCGVYCGLHDSNAALFAARGCAELGPRFSVVSTGTWFVCLSTAEARKVQFDPQKDMLANVDIDGRATPTARFMGGRFYEAWMGEALGARPRAEHVAVASRLEDPSEAAGEVRATWASLELARRADHALGLVASEGPILVEGRFAEDRVFGPALAALRPAQPVYRSTMADGVASGALRLVYPESFAPPTLISITPLEGFYQSESPRLDR